MGQSFSIEPIIIIYSLYSYKWSKLNRSIDHSCICRDLKKVYSDYIDIYFIYIKMTQ